MTSSINAKEETFFGHPKGLFILFFTEMWERFSFYGMKALLIFYLVKYHQFSDQMGNILIGSYAAMVYAMPVIGGYIADRYLGYRKAVIFGAILLVLGHIGMAYEGHAAYTNASGEIIRDTQAIQVLYASLAFIVMGVGFLKANISSIVGELYEANDLRRDSGFTIFYMGINMGSFLATLLCVWLGEEFGWSYGFGAAGVGMVLGLSTFIWGQKYFGNKAKSPAPEQLSKKIGGVLSLEFSIYLIAILSIGIVWSILQQQHIVESILMGGGIVSLVYIIYYSIFHLDTKGRLKLVALTILIVFTVIFWALFEQSYTSMNLFADRVLDRVVFGHEIKAGQMLSLNALFIVVFAPVFAMIWDKLSAVNKNPNTAVKFALGLLFVGLGFGMLVLGDHFSGDGKVAIYWMIFAYVFHTFGELCLSPVGLSAVTKLSPVKIVGFMMGVWFLATAGSEYIASLLANIASLDHSFDNSKDLLIAKKSYTGLFNYLFYTGLLFGTVLLAASPFLAKMMKDETND